MSIIRKLLKNKVSLLVLVLFALLLVLSTYFIFTQKNSNTTKHNPSSGNSTQPTATPDRIILNVTHDPSTSQSITWRTNTTVSHAMVEVAIADAAPNFGHAVFKMKAATTQMDATEIEESNTIAHYHSVTLNNLLPDTTYAYRVGSGHNWS